MKQWLLFSNKQTPDTCTNGKIRKKNLLAVVFIEFLISMIIIVFNCRWWDFTLQKSNILIIHYIVQVSPLFLMKWSFLAQACTMPSVYDYHNCKYYLQHTHDFFFVNCSPVASGSCIFRMDITFSLVQLNWSFTQ